MAKIEDVKVINVEGSALAVEDLSENIQNLVEIYNQFRHDEVEARFELIKVQTALRGMQQEIINVFKAEKDAAEKAEAESESEEVVSTEAANDSDTSDETTAE